MKNQIIENDIALIANANLPWEHFAGKNILVTGANGFLPAYMVETLLYLNKTKNLEIKIMALVKNQGKAKTRFCSYLERKDLHLIVQDVCAPLVTGKVDYIIHAASLASPKHYGSNPVETLLPNVIGTYNLLELARQKDVEGFLFFSTGEVYGENFKAAAGTKEDDYGYLNPINVRSCYAESKRMGENMCISWHHQHGVPAKIVRPFHTYGPGMDLNDGRVFADFVADIVHNRDIVMKSDGAAVRSFCYLSDATIGFFSVLLNGENAQAYNISNPDCKLTILELANKLTSLFPDRSLKVIIHPYNENPGYIQSKILVNFPDITKASRLGWKPTISIQEGFTKTIKSFL